MHPTPSCIRLAYLSVMYAHGSFTCQLFLKFHTCIYDGNDDDDDENSDEDDCGYDDVDNDDDGNDDAISFFKCLLLNENAPNSWYG